MTLGQLRRLRWAVRAVLFLGVAASVAANMLHAPDDPIAQGIAAWPPLALLATIEVIARVPVHRRDLAVLRMLATIVIGAIAAWVSYWHMAAVAGRFGEAGITPYLLPISVDGMVIVASVSLVELAGRIRTAQADTTVPAGTNPAAQPTPTPAQAPVALQRVPERQPVVAALNGANGHTALQTVEHPPLLNVPAIDGPNYQPDQPTPTPAIAAEPTGDAPAIVDPQPTASDDTAAAADPLTDEKRAESRAGNGQHADPTPPAADGEDEIPKYTKDAVVYLLRQDPSLDAATIAEKLNRHPKTVRRYMPDDVKRTRESDRQPPT
nr:DUF2637 domain-containing protein [Pilimelia terevasa]